MLNQPTSSPMMKTMFGFLPFWAAIALTLALCSETAVSNFD